MKKIGNMRSLAATTILGLSLSMGGCDAEAGRGDLEGDRFSNPFCEDDASTLAGIAVSVLEQAEYINGYAATAVDLLSIGCPDTTLEDIREIVEDEIDESQLNEYTSDMNSLVTLMNEYSRPDCTDPSHSTKLKCNPYEIEDELGDDVDRVTKNGVTSTLALWNRFTSNDESLDRRRLFHAQSLQLIAAGRLTFMGERIALEEIKSWPDDQDGDVESAKTNRCNWANNHAYPVIVDLETRFDEYFEPNKKVVDTWTTGCGALLGCKTAKKFKVCFPGVDGEEECTTKAQTHTESFQCDGGVCVEGATDEELFAEAAAMIEAGPREKVLGGDAYDTTLAQIRDIVDTCAEESETCAPEAAFDAGPLWNHGHAQDTCPGVCEKEGGSFTGGWWTTIAGEMSVCQCAFDC